MGYRVKTCPKCGIQHKKRGPFCGAICANSRPKPRKNPPVLDPRTVPGNYKVKNCKRCGIPHKKQGPFCSQSCGSTRPHSEVSKRRKSIKMIQYHQTPEGMATVSKVVSARKRYVDNLRAKANGEYILIPDDYAVQIPNLDDDDKIIW